MSKSVDTLEKDFNKLVEANKKIALKQMVFSKKEMTLSDFAKLAENAELLNVSIGEIFFDQENKKVATPTTSSSTKRAKSSKKSTATSVDTRTPVSRKAYDEALYKALKGLEGGATSVEIRNVCGGSELQFRKAAGRLVKRKLIKREGKARSTKYKVV